MIRVEKLIKEQSGQGMAEYALMLAFVAIAVVSALSPVGELLAQLFADVTAGFN